MNKFIAILLLGMTAIVGYFLPIPMPIDIFHQIRYLDSAMAMLLGVFVWGSFHLVEPTNHSKQWMTIRDLAIPIVWILIIWLLAIWFRHLYQHDFGSLIIIH